MTGDRGDRFQSAASQAPPHVMLLLRSLDRGGAQRQAVTLARALKARGWPISVVCFYGRDPLVADLGDAGVPFHDLGKRSRWDVVAFLFRLWRLLHAERPDILHGYLPIPNLLAVMMRPFFPGMRVVWGVRASNMDLSCYDWLVRLYYRLERGCARFADLVIANSEAGARWHIAQGFPEATMQVIPNGIDTDRFRFEAAGRERVRHEWKVPDDATLVGLIGRLNPMKDHQTFLKAAARLAAGDKRWHFVCIGNGPADYREKLVTLAAELGLAEWLTWAGSRDDMAVVYSALDIAVSSSSFGEGFPNVMAESMACGRPCVVTDVGDSASIVDELGVVVPPCDAADLASGIERLQARLETEGDALRKAARERIVTQFSVEALVNRTATTLQALMPAPSSADK